MYRKLIAAKKELSGAAIPIGLYNKDATIINIKGCMMNKTTITIVFKTVVVLLLILFITPLFYGYRLMFIQEYAFDLEATEKICSIIFGTIGTVATVAAIWTAILVPKQIAQRQNDIALFDKRLNVYLNIQTIYVFYKDLKIKLYNISTLSSKEIYFTLALFKVCFLPKKTTHTSDVLNEAVASEINKCISDLFSIVNSGVFLFAGIDYEMNNNMLTSLTNLVYACLDFIYEANPDNQEKASIAFQTFLQNCDDFEAKYLDDIESQLYLSK